MLWRRRKSRNEDLDREIRSHLALEAEEQQGNGLSPDNARYAAKRALGNETLIKEETRATWAWSWLDRLKQDFTYSLRQMRRSPGIFTIAVLLIAFSIGANTLLFTFVEALLLRPLPVRQPQTLVQLFQMRPGLPPYPYWEYGLYHYLKKSSTTLVDVICQIDFVTWFEHGRTPERLYVQRVSGNYFQSLGIRAAAGRLFGRDDDHVAVLSYDFWARSFNRDPSVIGHLIRIAGHPYQIVGVTPEQFNGTSTESSPDVRVPERDLLDFTANSSVNVEHTPVEIVARLGPSIALAQAQQELAALLGRYQEVQSGRAPRLHDPSSRGPRLELQSISGGQSPLRSHFRIGLLWMLAGTAFVLLMVCATVGGLLLARAAAREKETAIRRALGASSGRLRHQWLIESLLITALGGGLGVLLAFSTAPLLVHWMPPVKFHIIGAVEARPVLLTLHPDLRIIVYCILTFGLATILCACAPAWHASKEDLRALLQMTISGVRHQQIQTALCASQIALCTVLLIAAGLLLRSLSKLNGVNPGFDRRHIVAFTLEPEIHHYSSKQVWSLQTQLMREASTLPGVQAVGIGKWPLMIGVGYVTTVVLPGQALPSRAPNTSVNSVTPGYFKTLGIRLIEGREFRTEDEIEDQTPRPAIVNQAFARRFFQNGDPLGREFAIGSRFLRPEFKVIGVVNNTKYRSIREVPPPIYYTCDFGPTAYPAGFILYVHTAGAPSAIIQPMRQILRSINAGLTFYGITTLAQKVEQSLWQERVVAALNSWFGLVAILLSGIGVYGSVSHFVSRKYKEIGLRMAFGATRGDVLRLIATQLMRPLLIGVLVGVFISFWLEKLMRSLLYGVQLLDPVALAVALALLIVVAIAAAVVPAVRAVNIEPGVALRYE